MSLEVGVVITVEAAREFVPGPPPLPPVRFIEPEEAANNPWRGKLDVVTTESLRQLAGRWGGLGVVGNQAQLAALNVLPDDEVRPDAVVEG